MTTEDDDNPAIGVALLGGMAMLAWFLWLRRGTGSGRNNGDGGPPIPVDIWLRAGNGVEIDGAVSDLPTAIARARAARRVRLHVPGDVRHSWFETVLAALRATGADVGVIDPSYLGADVVVHAD